MIRKESKLGDLWILLALVALLGTAVWMAYWSRGARGSSPTPPPGLTKPIRLEVTQSGAPNELILALQVHHYRAQPLGEAEYVDYYFDDQDWSLARSGYSYRFRVRPAAEDAGRFALRLEREDRHSQDPGNKLDLRDDLPLALGDQIEQGAWSIAVAGREQIEARDRLAGILEELEIDSEEIAPRLRAELYRSRFDITDKGQSWFELDVEQWEFKLLDPAGPASSSRFLNFVIDTRLSRNDPELRRRVRTMQMMSEMLHASRPTELAPHEQALQELTSNGKSRTEAKIKP